tara:strand:- start:34833 stop:35012 length:180 start_codon:yes stop_codon:yes gene_type:complete
MADSFFQASVDVGLVFFIVLINSILNLKAKNKFQAFKKVIHLPTFNFVEKFGHFAGFIK